VKTVSDKGIGHSLAYLSMWKWLVGNVPFHVKIWQKLTHPLRNADFQAIFARSALASQP